MALKFSVNVNFAKHQAAFAAIGSKEFPRAIAFALDETAKSATTNFRDRVMPQVLARTLTKFSKDGIQYLRSGDKRYDTITEVKHISTSVMVSDGKHGRKDRSSYFKYLFGSGTNVRSPGDVGLDTKNIKIPIGSALNSRSASRSRDYDGGKQPGGMMAMVLKNLVKGAADPMETAMGIRPQDAGMRRMARRKKSTLSDQYSRSNLLRGVNQLYGMEHSEALASGNFERANKAARGMTRSLLKRIKPNAWSVFKKADTSGAMTFFARPLRIRDPSGGHHYVKRRDGTYGQFPDMLKSRSRVRRAGQAGRPAQAVHRAEPCGLRPESTGSMGRERGDRDEEVREFHPAGASQSRRARRPGKAILMAKPPAKKKPVVVTDRNPHQIDPRNGATPGQGQVRHRDLDQEQRMSGRPRGRKRNWQRVPTRRRRRVRVARGLREEGSARVRRRERRAERRHRPENQAVEIRAGGATGRPGRLHGGRARRIFGEFRQTIMSLSSRVARTMDGFPKAKVDEWVRNVDVIIRDALTEASDSLGDAKIEPPDHVTIEGPDADPA